MVSEMPLERARSQAQNKLKLIAIIPAAGSGERLGLGIPKALADIHGETILTRTLTKFLEFGSFARILVTAPSSELEIFKDSIERAQIMARRSVSKSAVESSKEICVEPELIAGGATRAESVRNAVNVLSQEKDGELLVVLHDAARIFVSEDLIHRCVEVAQRTGAATAAIPVVDTLRRGSKKAEVRQLGQVVARERLWGMQTPQVFRLSLLRHAFDQSDRDGLPSFIVSDDPDLKHQIAPEDADLYSTDEVGLVQRFIPVEYVQGSALNFKITTIEDLELARKIWGVS